MFIVKSNEQHIYGLTEKQSEVLKEYLTKDNPKYLSAKRYSKYDRISIPPYIFYFSEHTSLGEDNYLRVPIGVDVPKILGVKQIDILDKRISKEVKYPNFLLELREDQKVAKKDYLAQNLSGDTLYPKSIIQLPTGKGKSILGLNIAHTLKEKTLILVHKDDLVTGWQKDIKLCFGEDIEIGLIKAKKRVVGKQFTIATVQTLRRMSEEELSKYTDTFGLVIQDECHHVGLDMFNIINNFNSKYKLGLSATPKRSDGLTYTFDFYLGGICYKHKYDPNDTDICNVEVFIKETPYKYTPFLYEGVVYNLYDYKPEELPDNYTLLSDIPFDERPTVQYLTVDNMIVRSPFYKIHVCRDIIKEYQEGHSCIALFTQKEHINIYYNFLCNFIPKNKIMLYYGDSKEDSSVLMKRAESREVLVTLATYAKATEGTNVKAWEVEFLVSSMNNAKNVEQATGRIRRSNKGKLNPVRVYDYAVLKTHIQTRIRTYKELQYEIKDETTLNLLGNNTRGNVVFQRGYKRF